MESLLVLERFVECWRNHPGFQVDAFGNATFQGVISVRCGRDRHQCTALVRVRIDGHEHGRIRIAREAAFLAHFPHRDFSMPSNVYRFSGKDQALLVSGYSGTLAKKFVVVILPASTN